jgi:hypothetical protein
VRRRSERWITAGTVLLGWSGNRANSSSVDHR